MATDTFATLGKQEAIRQLFEGTKFKPFEEPVFFHSPERSYITTSTKSFLEGIDFDLVYFPLKHLGYKCVLATTAELFAVMSHPRTLSICLGVSAKLDFEQVKELWSGVLAAAREYGYRSLSLDIQPSKNGLAISVSATGETSELMAKRRSVVHSKDLICVSGALGAAFLGQSLLESEKTRFENGAVKTEVLEKYKMFVGAYLKPEMSASIVDHLEEAEVYPSFGYVVSMGLSDAVLKLTRDSGLGAKIYADKIPFEGNSFTLGSELDIDPISAAMNGGDDYKLLFTIPILKLDKFRADVQTFDIIGNMAQSEVGAVLLTPEGVELPLKAQGW